MLVYHCSRSLAPQLQSPQRHVRTAPLDPGYICRVRFRVAGRSDEDGGHATPRWTSQGYSTPSTYLLPTGYYYRAAGQGTHTHTARGTKITIRLASSPWGARARIINSGSQLAPSDVIYYIILFLWLAYT